MDEEGPSVPEGCVDEEGPSVPEGCVDEEGPSVPEGCVDEEGPSVPEGCVDEEGPSVPEGCVDEEGPSVPEGCVEPPESPVDVTPLPIKHVVLTTTGSLVPTLQEGCWAREQLPSGMTMAPQRQGRLSGL